jgi:prolyl 4-hydroxylase
MLRHNFTYPTVLHPDRKSNSHRRTSSYIVIPGEAEDNTASCVRERAESFLGFIPNVGLEELQIGRTQQGEHHALHWDYLLDPKPDDSGVVCNRAASFFVFLSNVEEGGETYFPFLEPPAGSNMDEKKFLRPVGEDSLGLMVRPVKGNAIFWMNMYSNGTLDERSMHAGMQVINGTKYGMNILAERCI